MTSGERIWEAIEAEMDNLYDSDRARFLTNLESYFGNRYNSTVERVGEEIWKDRERVDIEVPE